MLLIASPIAAQRVVNGSDAVRANTARITPVAVLPMMTVALKDRSKVRSSRAIDGYTRLTVELVPFDDRSDPRSYEDQGRSGWRRFFAGKSISRLLSIKSTLKRPRVSTTATIVSAGYDSNKQVGESWASEFNGQRMLTPYFRIDPDSAVLMEIELAVSSGYKATLASDVIDLLERATALVAPTSSLITSLNKERFSDASQFVDQTLSSLFNESISERSANDFALPDWAGDELARITVRLPLGNEITPGARNAKGQQPVEIGTWIIRSTEPILSVFSGEDAEAAVGTAAAAPSAACAAPLVEDKVACAALAGRISPHSVLNFQVDTGVTLNQALAGDTGVAAARDKLVATDGKNNAGNQGDVRDLCMVVAERAERLGFNRIDVAAILWAYTRQSFATEAVTNLIRKDATCPPLALAYKIGLPDNDGF